MGEGHHFIAGEQDHIKRKSVAMRQKDPLPPVCVVWRNPRSPPHRSAEGSRIRAREAEMIAKSVERTKAVAPEIPRYPLEDGDIIVMHPNGHRAVTVSAPAPVTRSL